jgi:hypothetical protein
VVLPDEVRERALHRDCRTDGVFVAGERSHNCVADRLHHSAAVMLDRCPEHVEAVPDQAECRRVAGPAVERGRGRQVAEEQRHAADLEREPEASTLPEKGRRKSGRALTMVAVAARLNPLAPLELQVRLDREGASHR